MSNADYFDSRVLTGVIVKRPPQWSLISDLFFKPQAPQPVENFEMHVLSRGRQLLPFVQRDEPGKVIETGSGEAVVLRAPRIRAKTLYKASQIVRNPLGYTAYDFVPDPVQLAIVEDLDYLRQDLDLVVEWMCASIATTGKIEVIDKIDGQSVKIYAADNRMPDSHKITISTASDKWDASTSKIPEMVEEWALMIQEESGFAPTDLILGKNVWGPFWRHADVKSTLDNRRIDVGSLQPKCQQMFKGVWNGLNIWAYAGNVTGYDGQTKYLLDPDSVLLGCRNADAVIEYGRPLDLECPGATTYFAKTYIEHDPSATWLLVESRPLPWAKRPGAFLCAKVL